MPRGIGALRGGVFAMSLAALQCEMCHEYGAEPGSREETVCHLATEAFCVVANRQPGLMCSVRSEISEEKHQARQLRKAQRKWRKQLADEHYQHVKQTILDDPEAYGFALPVIGAGIVLLWLIGSLCSWIFGKLLDRWFGYDTALMAALQEATVL